MFEYRYLTIKKERADYDKYVNSFNACFICPCSCRNAVSRRQNQQISYSEKVDRRQKKKGNIGRSCHYGCDHCCLIGRLGIYECGHLYFTSAGILDGQ